MKRVASVLMVISLLLGLCGFGVLAEETIEVSASFQDGVLTLQWDASSVPEGYVLSEVTVEDETYSVTDNGTGTVNVSMLLVNSTVGECVFVKGQNAPAALTESDTSESGDGTDGAEPSGDDSTASTEPSDSTTPSTSETEPPAPQILRAPFAVTVDLTITGTYIAEEKKLAIVWSGGSYLPDTFPRLMVRMDEKKIYLVSDMQSTAEGNVASVDLSDISGGIHSYEYVLSLNNESAYLQGGTFSSAGESPAVLTVTQKNGLYTAVLTDDRGNPIAGMTLTVTSPSFLGEAVTDEDGKATVNQYITDDPAKVVWTFAGATVGDVTYLATEGVATKPTEPSGTTPPTSVIVPSTSSGDSTTSTSATTRRTTRRTTKKTTKKPTTTIPLNNGGTSTSLYDTGVLVNAIYDKALLTQFGVSEQTFNETARLLMEQATYETLANRSSKAVMLFLHSTDDTLSDELLSIALEKSEEYGFYQAQDAGSLALTLGIAAMDKDGSYVLYDPAMLPEDVYTVYLPIPNEYKECDLALLSLESGDAELIEITPNGNYFAVDLSTFGTYALVAFPVVTRTLSVPAAAVVLFVLGGLAFVGAVAILFLFVIRKPVRKNEDEEPYDYDAVEDAEGNSAVLLTFEEYESNLYPMHEQEVLDPLFKKNAEEEEESDDSDGEDGIEE